MVITAVGSSRNYGVRYLLPLAPLAIVWISAIGKPIRPESLDGLQCLHGVRRCRHRRLRGRGREDSPYELTYFNALAGGPLGGRRILADSNLDWGQGLKSLARLQRQRPEITDMTLYYFGDTEPAHYGVAGVSQMINASG